MRGLWFPVLALTLIAAGCTRQASYTWSVGKPRQVQADFNVPECVVVDNRTGEAYVSSIVTPGEGYWEDDGTGYISRLKVGGKLQSLRWREGSAGAPVNAPKGMCIVGDVLYVADNTRVLRFALKGDARFAPLIIAGSRQLNDMATDGRYAYVSDTAGGNIYRLDGETAQTLLAPASVNGITFHEGRMYAVTWDTHEIYEVDLAGQIKPTAFGLASHFKGLDGVEVLKDGTFIVSDFLGNALFSIAPDRKTVKKLATLDSPADIGLDRKRKLVYVPLFMGNKVAIYKLEKK